MSGTPPKSSSIPINVQKKVSMTLAKGRPGSLSLPTFAFRFKNTDEENLEELCEINEVAEVFPSPDSNDKLSDESSERNTNSTSSPPTSPIRTSIPRYKPVTNKRTQSLDNGSPDHSSTSDTWSLFSEIKGKIARTVEEKLQSTGIIKKELKDVQKVVKPISPVEAQEATEDLEVVQLCPKSESTPFNLKKIWNSNESPQLRFRRKELQTSQSMPQPSANSQSLEERVALSGLLSSSSEDINKSDSLIDEKPSQPPVIEEKNSLTDVILTYEPHSVPIIATEEKNSVENESWRQKWKRHKRIALTVSLALMVWYILPSFLSGLILGAAFSIYANRVWKRINQSKRRASMLKIEANAASPTNNDNHQHPQIRKVWMNELLSEYSPECYHLSMTQSVLVRLDGSALRLSYPKSKVHKRAMWNESIHESSFIHQRYYDLNGAKVELLPDGLARKRRWSRRYPIQITFPEVPKNRDSTSLYPHLAKENEKELILFSRSGRDKEEWFWRFKEAILSAAEKLDSSLNSEHKLIQQRLFKYHVYMSRFVSPTGWVLETGSNSSNNKQHDSSSVDSNSSSPTPSISDNVEWLNVLMGRCCLDVLLDSEDNEWIERISDRIQRKLSLIKVPYFMEELRLSDLEVGSQLPQISSISSPYLNEKGLWFNLNISYFGSFRMTLETKLNLLRLKKDSVYEAIEVGKEGSEMNNSSGNISKLAAIYDSEAEESVESSSDEEPFPDAQGEVGDEPGRQTTGNKIFRLVDSIAQSRYFQHATEYKYVKKAMVGVSNTPLILTVELLSLTGTLSVNIPPPPTDRLWYGFRNNPDLVLVAKPKVGERQVQIAQITDWIEKKLVLEFQRILVLPNMEDLVIPILNSNVSMNPPNSTESDR